MLSSLNRVLRKVFALEVRRVAKDHAPEDLSGICTNPIESSYLSYGTPHYIEVPVQRCRQLSPMAFPCALDAGNPFVETIASYMRGNCAAYEDSPMFRYYRDWCPSTAAEIAGVSGHSGHFENHPPLAFVYPWQNDDPSEKLARWTSRIERENARYGLEMTISEGHKAWGPVSRAKGELEFRRLIDTYDSVKKSGYLRDLGAQVTGAVLVREGDWRVLIGHGQHRVAVLAAMGYATVPICFYSLHRRSMNQPEMIRIDDVEHWPHVRSGIYGSEEALAIFNRVFDALQPAGYRAAVREEEA